MSKTPSTYCWDVLGEKKEVWTLLYQFFSGFRAEIFFWILSEKKVSVIVKNTIDVCGEFFWRKKLSFRKNLQIFPDLERKILVGLSNQRSRFSGCLLLEIFFRKKVLFFGFSVKSSNRPTKTAFDVSREIFWHENKTEETFQLHKFPLSEEKLFRCWDNVFRKSCQKRLQRLGGTFWEERKKFERFCTNFFSGFRAEKFNWILSQKSVSVIVKNTIDVCGEIFWRKKLFFQKEIANFCRTWTKNFGGIVKSAFPIFGMLITGEFFFEKSVVFRIFCQKFQPAYQDCIWCIWSDDLT